MFSYKSVFTLFIAVTLLFGATIALPAGHALPAGQQVDKEGTRTRIPKPTPPKPQPPKPPKGPSIESQIAEALGKAINDGIQQGLENRRRNQGPVIVEGENFLRWVTCRNCGTRVREDQWQYHRCPQQVTVGNPQPTSVAKANPTSLKLADFDKRNVEAIQKTILDPLKDKQMDEVKKRMSDDQIATIIGDVSANTQPPLTNEETDDLMKAIRNGDSDKVKDILQGKNVSAKNLSTLTGLADAKNLIKKYDKDGTIKQSDIKKLIDTLNNGDSTYLGGLTSDLKTLGKINKIATILDIASLVLGGGSALTVTNIPTGIVAIVVFPDLPYGVIFPLGNGVYGMGTGGKGQTGIYQGYIPQPTVYGSGNEKVTTFEVELGWNPEYRIFRNGTSEEVKYYVDGKANTLGENAFTMWGNGQSRMPIRLPSGRSNTYTSTYVNPGAYEFVKAANGAWSLKEEKT
jgi:hypothetical protein